MIYEHDFKAGIKDIGKNNLIKNKTILEMLENIGAYHSDLAGYGANDIETTNVAWVLLAWKLNVIKRPKYGQTMHIKTWGRDMSKAFTYRDFEVYDEQNNLCAKATSKWVLVNTKTGKLTKITQEVADSYQIEEKSIYENREIEKPEIPQENEYTNTIEYQVIRRDIDINGHMHNLYYLDIAYEALPEEVYKNRPYNNIKITYKKEVKLGEKLKCKYALHDNKHIVVIYNQDESIIHTIIELYN